MLDDDTLEAGRVPQTGSPSVLKRVDASAAMAAFVENDEITTLAERDASLAESDEGNAQAWSMCSAVAFKCAMGNGDESARFAQQMAQVLQTILVGTANPCLDAIPHQYW